MRCLIWRWHKWRTFRTESVRYGVLVTQRCAWCKVERTIGVPS